MNGLLSLRINRRGVLAMISSGALEAVCRSSGAATLLQQPSDPPEPNYTVTLQDGGHIYITARVEARPDGGTSVHAFTRSGLQASASKYNLDTVTVRDASGHVSRASLYLGTNAETAVVLEAKPNRDSTAYLVRTPAQDGKLAFGATLFAPLISALFVGRMYDWKRGGEQTFAMLAEEGIPTAEMVTLKLTAESGEETIDLPDGPVKARKLRYSAPLTALPREQKTGLIYVGPLGELLRCDTAFFGIPLKMKGPARWEKGGERFALRFGDGQPNSTVILIRADRSVAGWDVTVEVENGPQIATASCDKQFRMIRLATPWHVGKFTAEVIGQQVVYHIEPGPTSPVPTPTGRPVFPTDAFVTEFWEGPGRSFGDLEVGATRDGDWLQQLTGDASGTFTMERMPDLPATGPNGSTITARHYRLIAKLDENAPKIELGQPVLPARTTWDIYTDGRRTLAFFFSDGRTVVRDGWERWAKALPKTVATVATH